MNQPIITVIHLNKTYRTGNVNVPAVKDLSFQIYRGEFVGLMGPSGSGKSTTMHQLGLLDTPTSGTIVIDSSDVSRMTEDHKTRFRLEK